MNSLRSRSAGSLEEDELGADDSGGLWGMCRLNEAWPISVCVLQAALGEGRPALNNSSAEWEQACFSAKISKTTAWLLKRILNIQNNDEWDDVCHVMSKLYKNMSLYIYMYLYILCFLILSSFFVEA